LHPYKIQLKHEIKDTDPIKKAKYANSMLNETDEDFPK
jgi:hypothetical protein